MSELGFLKTMELVRDALEINPIGSVFERPGEVAPLPRRTAAIKEDKLRDKPSPGVKKGPVNKDAFLNLLEAKAYFLRLPKPIVMFVKESSLVSISEELPKSTPAGEGAPNRTTAAATGAIEIDVERADAVLHKKGGEITGVTMHVPAACESLASAGRGLGRPATGRIPGCDREYAVLDLLYHEMTHAWLYLQEFSDQGIKNLYQAGCAAYENPKDRAGNTFRATQDGLEIKETAFQEAAAEYVQVRVSRWTTALCGLAELLRATPKPDKAQESLQKIVDAYELPRSAYGTISGKPIKEPELSDHLRAEIDLRILDWRPLTERHLMDTPLAELHAAVLEKAKKKK